MQGVTQQMNQKYQEDQMADMLHQADDDADDHRQHGPDAGHHLADGRRHARDGRKNEEHDHGHRRIAGPYGEFRGLLPAIRSYFYWEKHCYDIPVCWSLRSVFDALDGIDMMTDDIQSLLPIMEHLDTLMPQMVALMP